MRDRLLCFLSTWTLWRGWDGRGTFPVEGKKEPLRGGGASRGSVLRPSSAWRTVCAGLWPRIYAFSRVLLYQYRRQLPFIEIVETGASPALTPGGPLGREAYDSLVCFMRPGYHENVSASRTYGSASGSDSLQEITRPPLSDWRFTNMQHDLYPCLDAHLLPDLSAAIADENPSSERTVTLLIEMSHQNTVLSL